MTLQRQTVSIPIGVGRDDSAAAPYADGNAAADNVVFTKRGLARKRPPMVGTASGMPTTATTVVDSGGVPALFGQTAPRLLDEALDAFVTTNECGPRTSSIKIDPLIRGRIQAINPSIAVLQDVLCVVWTDTEQVVATAGTGANVAVTEGDLWCAFFSVADDALTLLSGPAPVSGWARAAHVVALETGSSTRCFVLIGEQDDDGMQWARYALSTGTYTWPTATAFGGQRDVANRGFDVCGSNGGTARAFAVWEASGGLGARIVSIAATGSPTVTDYAGHPSAVIFHDSATSKIVTADFTGRLGVTDDSLAGTGTSIPLTHTLNVNNCDRCVIGRYTSTTLFVAFSDYRINATLGQIGAMPAFWGLEIVTLTAAYAEAVERLVPNIGILAKPYYSSLNVSLLPVFGYASKRGFLISLVADDNGTINPAVHASFSSQLEQAGNRINLTTGPGWSCPTVVDSSGSLFVAYPVALALSLDATESVALSQLDLVRANVTAHAPARVVKANDLPILASGHGLGCLDGHIAAEVTPQRPDPPLITKKSAAFGFPAPGASASSVYVSVGWGWLDATGREHRGPISEQTECVWDSLFAVAGPTATPKLWGAPIPFPTSILGERYKVLFLDVYCSLLGDASQVRKIARLYDPPEDADFPDCKVFFFGQSGTGTTDGFVILSSDVTAAYGGALPVPYTDTELASSAPAGLLDVVSTQSRLWALSAESRFSVLVTKPVTTGYAPEFADELSIDVPQEGGECVGLAAVDDKVVVFKERRIYVIVGDPGDAAGERSTVQKPRLLSSDIGCVCAASIVEGPFGVAFQSERGIELLSRGLELRFLGERVQDVLSTGQRLAGSLIPGSSQVRWVIAIDSFAGRWSPNGDVIVWDYLGDAFSTWSSYSATSIAQVGAVPWSVSANGTASHESDLTADYASAGYNVTVTTPWIKVNGIQGFQRVWRVVALLYYFNGDVTISIAYDYDDADVDSTTWLEGVAELLPAANGRLHLSVRPTRQKCESIRVTITSNAIEGQSPPYPTVGRGIDLVSLDAEIGVKSGTVRRKLAAEAKG